jgi:hypothetical protein
MRTFITAVTSSAVLLGSALLGAPSASAASGCEIAPGTAQVGDRLTVSWNMGSLDSGPNSGQPFTLVSGSVKLTAPDIPNGLELSGTVGGGLKPGDSPIGSIPPIANVAGTYTVTCKAELHYLNVSPDVLVSGSATAVVSSSPSVVPTITSLSPSNGASAGGDTVTITGADLSTATSVTFGQQDAPILSGSASSASTILVTSPPANGAPLDTAAEVVVTLGTGEVATLRGGWTWNSPAPAITGVTPPCEVFSGTDVTITGTNLAGVTDVYFGDPNGPDGLLAHIDPTRISDTSLTVRGATKGTQSVFVNFGSAYVANPSVTVTSDQCPGSIPAPIIDKVATNPNGGIATVNWHVPDANRPDVQGVKYWLQPGNTPFTPVGGTYNPATGYGQFQLAGLTSQINFVTLMAIPRNSSAPPIPGKRFRFDFASKPTIPAVLGAPVVDSVATVTAGGLLTVNYSIPQPVGVLGVEYQIGSGPWLRPGGTAPSGSVGGTFTVPGLTEQQTTVTLRSVSTDTPPKYAPGAPAAVTFAGKPTAASAGSGGQAPPASAGGPVPERTERPQRRPATRGSTHPALPPTALCTRTSTRRSARS